MQYNAHGTVRPVQEASKDHPRHPCLSISSLEFRVNYRVSDDTLPLHVLCSPGYDAPMRSASSVQRSLQGSHQRPTTTRSRLHFHAKLRALHGLSSPGRLFSLTPNSPCGWTAARSGSSATWFQIGLYAPPVAAAEAMVHHPVNNVGHCTTHANAQPACSTDTHHENVLPRQHLGLRAVQGTTVASMMAL